jgi:nicotinate-nucleotide adenylyltransferase
VTARRVGILGGTFDPIHRGHLDVALAAQRAVSLSEVLIVPASAPPHRPQPVASGYHRFAMIALAIANHPDWRVSDLELQRSDPSYTATTLGELGRLGYLATELFFIIGADAFTEIESWMDYPSLLDMASFLVVSRPGHPATALRDRLPALASRMTNHPRPAEAPSIVLIDDETADVSATAIRERCARGQSISGLVPPLVDQHIEREGLYRPSGPHEGRTRFIHDRTAGSMHGQD